jgi:hypothetical protein
MEKALHANAVIQQKVDASRNEALAARATEEATNAFEEAAYASARAEKHQAPMQP